MPRTDRTYPHWLIPYSDTIAADAARLKRLFDDIGFAGDKSKRWRLAEFLFRHQNGEVSDCTYNQSAQGFVDPGSKASSQRGNSYSEEVNSLAHKIKKLHQALLPELPNLFYNNGHVINSVEALTTLLEQEAFYTTIVAARHVQRHLSEKTLSTFEYELQREATRRQRVLKGLQSHVEKTHAPFDAHRLFIDHGLGRDWVLTSDSYITPLIAQKGIFGITPSTYFPFRESTIAGYRYNIGFAKRNVSAGGDREGRYIVPVITVDDRILGKMQQSDTGMSLLRGLRTLSGYAEHDWFHHMMFVMFAGSDKKLFLNTPNAPLFTPTAPAYAESALPNVTKLRLSQHFKDDTVADEKLAAHTHKESWQQLFKKKPALKIRLLAQTAQYLTQLKEFRQELLQSGQATPEEAEHMTAYLALIAMDRVFMVVAPDDPQLAKPIQQRFANVQKHPAALYASIQNLIGALQLAPPASDIMERYLGPDNATIYMPEDQRSSGNVVKANKRMLFKRKSTEDVLWPKFHGQYRAIKYYVEAKSPSPYAAFLAHMASEGFASTPFWLHDKDTQHFGARPEQTASEAKAFYDFFYDGGPSSQEIDERLKDARAHFKTRSVIDRHAR